MGKRTASRRRGLGKTAFKYIASGRATIEVLPKSLRRSAAACPCSWTAASVAAQISSRLWRWAPKPYVSAGPTSGASVLSVKRVSADSPLEEGVRSELVSEAKFPANTEIYREIWRADTGRNSHLAQRSYKTIPYASEQGIRQRLTGT